MPERWPPQLVKGDGAVEQNGMRRYSYCLWITPNNPFHVTGDRLFYSKFPRVTHATPCVPPARERGRSAKEPFVTSLRDILADPVDSSLCDRLFVRIAERSGNELDVTRTPEPDRTVQLVWHSYGIIGNGGFQYLLEGDFKGDPGFQETANSYRRIGCKTAAACFDRLFACFPNGEVPADIDKRLRRYQNSFSGFPNKVDEPFFSASKDIERCLAAYIRANASAFAHLE